MSTLILTPSEARAAKELNDEIQRIDKIISYHREIIAEEMRTQSNLFADLHTIYNKAEAGT